VGGVLALLLALGLGVATGCGGGHGSSGSVGSVYTLSPAAGTVLPSAQVSTAYQQTFTVVAGGKAPYTFTPISVPPGLTLGPVPTTDDAVELTGTPTQQGTQTVSFQIVDSTQQVVENESYQLPIS
jgi:hypothetical protein